MDLKEKEKKKANFEAIAVKYTLRQVLSLIPGQSLLNPTVRSTKIQRSGEEAVVSPD